MPGPSTPEGPKPKRDAFTKIEQLRNKFGSNKNGISPAQLEVLRKLYPDTPLKDLLNKPMPPPSEKKE